MSGTAAPRLVPETRTDDESDEGRERRRRLDGDRSAPAHVFGAPLVLDAS